MRGSRGINGDIWSHFVVIAIGTALLSQGFGVSKLFQFFLIQSEAATKRVSDGGDGQSRGSTDRVPRGLKDVAQVADSAVSHLAGCLQISKLQYGGLISRCTSP